MFSIQWKPYYLNYGPTDESVDKRALVEEKLSGMRDEQREKLFRRMDQIGGSVGISFSGGGKIGDTRQAHRLVHLSQDKSAEVRKLLVEKIYGAYHELEKDISKKEVLCELAVEAGLDAEEVDGWLGSDRDGDLVDEEAQKNRDLVAGSGVPFYVIQGEHKIDGAQDAQDFMEVFVAVKEREAEEGQ